MTTRQAADSSVGELQVFKAGFFRALAHPVRIRILELLVKGDRIDALSPRFWACGDEIFTRAYLYALAHADVFRV